MDIIICITTLSGFWLSASRALYGGANQRQLSNIFTITGLSAGVTYLMVSLSFLKLRKSKPDWERPFKVKAGNVLGVISVIFTGWVVYTCTKSMDMGRWIAVGLYFALGISFFLYVKKMQKQKPEEWKPIILSPDNVNQE